MLGNLLYTSLEHFVMLSLKLTSSVFLLLDAMWPELLLLSVAFTEAPLGAFRLLSFPFQTSTRSECSNIYKRRTSTWKIDFIIHRMHTL